MNPTITLDHNVRILIIIDNGNVTEISSTYKFKKLAKLASATPNPPGIIETAPNTTDER
jgi:hypothetical protein